MNVKKSVINEIPNLPESLSVTGVDWYVNTRIDFSGDVIINDINSSEHTIKEFTYNFKQGECVFVKVDTHLSNGRTIYGNTIQVFSDTVIDGTHQLSYAPEMEISYMSRGRISVKYTEPKFYDKSSTVGSMTLRLVTLSHQPFLELDGVTDIYDGFVIDKADYAGKSAFLIEVNYNYLDGEKSLIGRELVIANKETVDLNVDVNSHDHSKTTVCTVMSAHPMLVTATYDGAHVPVQFDKVFIPDYIYGTRLNLVGETPLYGSVYTEVPFTQVGKPVKLIAPIIEDMEFNDSGNLGAYIDNRLYSVSGSTLTVRDVVGAELKQINVGFVLNNATVSPLNANTFAVSGTVGSIPHIITYVIDEEDIIELDIYIHPKEAKFSPYLIDGYYTLGDLKYNPYTNSVKGSDLNPESLNINRYVITDTTISNVDTIEIDFIVKHAYPITDGLVLFTNDGIKSVSGTDVMITSLMDVVGDESYYVGVDKLYRGVVAESQEES